VADDRLTGVEEEVWAPSVWVRYAIETQPDPREESTLTHDPETSPVSVTLVPAGSTVRTGAESPAPLRRLRRTAE
jgi:hypothetical protein